MISGIFHEGSQELNLSDIVISMPFIKGHVGFNKGLKLAGEYRNCLRCNKEIWVVKSRLKNGGGNYCSQDCSNKSTANPGKAKKKIVGYWGVHSWLYKNFGKASKCEQCGSQVKVQWSKLKDKSYERNRENFWQLCSSCHMAYDNTYVKGGWNKGKQWPVEVKEKISKALKGKPRTW